MNKKPSKPKKPIPPGPGSPKNWVGHTFVGSASGHTGRVEMRWLRIGNNLTIEVPRYMFSAIANHNKANINIIVDAHNAGEWELKSPDDRKQDGQWHPWGAGGTLALGSSTRITVKVVLIFDMGGPDDKATVILVFNV